MKEYAAGIQSSELRLVDGPASASGGSDAEGTPAPLSGSAGEGGAPAPRSESRGAHLLLVSDSSAAGASRDAPPANADKFLTAATKEYEAGIIDQPLWTRALAQAADRTCATEAYLRARATALRVQKRDLRQEREARRTRAIDELDNPAVAATTPAAAAPTAPARRAGPTSRQVFVMGGALALLVVIAVWFAIPALQQDAVKTAPASRPAAQKPARPTASAPKKPAATEVAAENLAAKVQSLKSDGNWNVIVIYATEWTRKQPANADGWRELAAGYMRLRQYREALDAASKVVELAPEDAAGWQTLGQINLALQQPAEALAAFEQAVARDDRDLASIVQTGTLNTQLGRFPDARIAFAKALALNPQDVEALCGTASLAQKEGRAKDAEALTRQIASLGTRCREGNVGETVRVAAGVADKSGPAGSTSR